MVTELAFYRNSRGETFYRTSPTCGRTGSYHVEAESRAHLERWLKANGFHRVTKVARAA
jgi:hypothetical protein